MEALVAAFVIANVDVTDPVEFERYRAMVPATIEKFGGRYLVRGGKHERLEGDSDPKRIIVLQFDSFERAKEWWDSEEYREPKALRQKSARSRIILVEGL